LKIRKITPWLVSAPQPYMESAGEPAGAVRPYLFVQLETDEGVTGWGEVTNSTPSHNAAVWAMLGQSNDLLVGDDVSHIEAIWHKTFRAFTYMGSRGATSHLVSGIDIALWDIRGKVLGRPLYELLGGPVRDRIALYTHPNGGSSIDGIVRAVKAIVESGHTALKTDPFPLSAEERATPYGYLSGQIDASAEHAGIDTIAAVREAVGADVEVLIDAHGRFDVPTATRLATRLAEYRIGWFEEPVPVESYEALRQVKAQIPVPICVGERLFTRFDILPVLKDGLADYLMPDVTWTGGITELRKIASLAETFYIPVSPHDASGPINILAGAHVMMTVPNFYKLETMRADLGAYDAFIDYPLDIRAGHLHLSDRPGLGVELDVDYLRAHTIPVTPA
jgi:galactonate dehydratase